MKLDIKIMSFNIRYDNVGDGKNQWGYRRENVFDLVKKYSSDFICFQEVMLHQYIDLEHNLPSYRALGRSRDVSPQTGEACPIFYLHEKWHWLENETFWLSDTPKKPGSKSWGSLLPRIATYTKFESKINQEQIVIYNTHLDYHSEQVRVKNIKVLLEHIEQNFSPIIPLVVTGDFNANPHSESVSMLIESKFGLRDSFKNFPTLYQARTFHGWNNDQSTGKIDFIFTNTSVESVSTIEDTYNGNYPSDHFPILAGI
jgi:endonuclease/exonuclease/phosphatase family metal-dependent hydrolase